MTLTAAQIRPFVTALSLEDADFQILVDAAYAVIDSRIGPAGERTELLYGGFRTIALGRPTASVSLVTETIGVTTTTLNANDYRLRPDGYTLERLRTGLHPRWRWLGLVEVTSTPVDDDAIRDEVAIDLCKLAVTYNPGLTAETIGTWSEQYAANSAWNNAAERESILSRLDPSPGIIVVGGPPHVWGSW